LGDEIQIICKKLPFLLICMLLPFNFFPLGAQETDLSSQLKFSPLASLSIQGEKTFEFIGGETDEEGNLLYPYGQLNQTFWIRVNGKIGKNIDLDIDYDDRPGPEGFPPDPIISLDYRQERVATPWGPVQTEAALSNQLEAALEESDLILAHPGTRFEGLRAGIQGDRWEIKGVFSRPRGISERKEFRGQETTNSISLMEEDYLTDIYYFVSSSRTLSKVLVDDNDPDNNYGLTRDPVTGTFDEVLNLYLDYVVTAPGEEFLNNSFRIMTFSFPRGSNEVVRVIYSDGNFEFLRGAYRLLGGTIGEVESVWLNDYRLIPEEDFHLLNSFSGCLDDDVIVLHRRLEDSDIIEVYYTTSSSETIRDLDSGVNQEISKYESLVPLIQSKEIKGKYFYLGQEDIKSNSETIESYGRTWVRLHKNSAGQYVDSSGRLYTDYEVRSGNPGYYWLNGVAYGGFYLLDYQKGIITIFRTFEGNEEVDRFRLTNNRQPSTPSTVLSVEYEHGITSYQLGIRVIPGSEVVRIKRPTEFDYIRLTRDRDYTIDYNNGVVSIHSDLIAPDTLIIIDYQRSPFGAPLDNYWGAKAQIQLTDQLSLGGTIIYAGANIPSLVPSLLEIPESKLFWDVETELQLGKSLTLKGEAVQSHHCPNLYQQVLLDGMAGEDLVGFEGRWKPDQEDNFLEIYPINNDAGGDGRSPSPYYQPYYTPPPVTDTEEKTIQQSLVMKVTLEVGKERYIFQNLSSTGVDISFYQRLQYWVYFPENTWEGLDIYCELWADDENYFRFIKRIDSYVPEDWQQFSFPLGSPQESLGSPLSGIRQVRFGLRNSGTGSKSVTLWLDDLRLKGVEEEISHAYQLRLQGDYSRLQLDLSYRWIEKGFSPLGVAEEVDDSERWEASITCRPRDFLETTTTYYHGLSDLSSESQRRTSEGYGEKFILTLSPYSRLTTSWGYEKTFDQAGLASWKTASPVGFYCDKLMQSYEFSQRGFNFIFPSGEEGELTLRYTRTDQWDYIANSTSRTDIQYYRWRLFPRPGWIFIPSYYQEIGQTQEEITSRTYRVSGDNVITAFPGLVLNLKGDSSHQENIIAGSDRLTSQIETSAVIGPNFIFNPFPTLTLDLNYRYKDSLDLLNPVRDKEEKIGFVLHHQTGDFLTSSESYTFITRETQSPDQPQPLKEQIQEYSTKQEIAWLSIFPAWRGRLKEASLKGIFSLIRTFNFTIAEETTSTTFSLTWEAFYLSDLFLSLQYQQKMETKKPTTWLPSIVVKTPLGKNLNLDGDLNYEIVEETSRTIFGSAHLTWRLHPRWELIPGVEGKFLDEEPATGHETDSLKIDFSLQTTYFWTENIDFQLGYKFTSFTLYQGTYDDPSDFTAHEGRVKLIARF